MTSHIFSGLTAVSITMPPTSQVRTGRDTFQGNGDREQGKQSIDDVTRRTERTEHVRCFHVF